MEELRKLLLREVEERELVKTGIKRIRERQTITICIGILILIMFTFNFVQARRQIQASNDVIHAARLLIDAQQAEIDSLLQPQEFMPIK